jgi:deoxyribodipyrimidine photolyase-related protein
MRVLRLILGDQLNHQHSWFQSQSDHILYVMMELRSETDYVVHHIQKVLGFFAAMRGFEKKLLKEGHKILYLTLDDPRNQQSFTENLRWIAKEHGPGEVQYMLPDEYRLDQELSKLSQSLSLPTVGVDSEHFLTARDDLARMFAGKKTFLMESFYRSMRRRFNILMDGEEPYTGQWNYDHENRKRLDPRVKVPAPLLFRHDLSDIARMVEQAGVKTIGRVTASEFPWPITREEGLKLLQHFLKHGLPNFGTFQDALTPDHDWLFHSRLSFVLNTKLLSPMEVIESTIQEWRKRTHEISYSQVEGFVRQILGWREFVRGIYWAKMPKYERENFFNHRRKLPSFFWTGETKMRCVGHAVRQSLDLAYAHHIQRLMITGNFALLAGIDPDEIDAWYLGIYIDALQWVELPNTRGMSQFADGGLLATKPYISSANYIDKMSTYCADCFYDRKKRVGDRACPFNSLYWDFFARNDKKLRGNPRISMAYKNLDRMADLVVVREQAKLYLKKIEEL